MKANSRALVQRADEIPSEPVPLGKGIAKQVLIGADTAPNFALRRFAIAPGGHMPRHTNQVEHEQYVLQGRAEVGIGDTVHHVQRGDVVFIPADVPHWYRTEGEEPFVFLCIVPNRPDQTTVLEAD